MKTKKHKILYTLLIVVGVLFVSFKVLVYSENFVDYTKHESIQKQYHLDLHDSKIPMDTNWKYFKCSRWSLINDTYYLIRNPFVRLPKISNESNFTSVVLFLAENEYTFSSMRDNIRGNEVLAKQNIDYRGLGVELKLVRSNTSIPYCVMDFEYKHKYYKVIFYPNSYHEDLQFFAAGSEIHPDALHMYLEYLDQILK